MVANYHSRGQDHITNTPGTAADYFDFRADGKVYASISGTKDTTAYELIGDTKIVFAGSQLFKIFDCTSLSLIIKLCTALLTLTKPLFR